jgi:hypothetical protein
VLCRRAPIIAPQLAPTRVAVGARGEGSSSPGGAGCVGKVLCPPPTGCSSLRWWLWRSCRVAVSCWCVNGGGAAIVSVAVIAAVAGEVVSSISVWSGKSILWTVSWLRDNGWPDYNLNFFVEFTVGIAHDPT